MKFTNAIPMVCEVYEIKSKNKEEYFMAKKEYYQVDITGNRGSTTINRSISQLAESRSEAERLAKDRYRAMHPDAKNVSVKKSKLW